MIMQETTEVVCNFESEDALDKAVSELQKNEFSKKEMGYEKTINELKSLSPELDNVSQEKVVKEPKRIRDSIKDTFWQSRVIGGMLSVVGLGLFTATFVAIITLEKIDTFQAPAYLMLALGAVLMMGGIGISRWVLQDNKKQFKEQNPQNRFRFWVKTPSEKSKQAAMNILRKYGANHLKVNYNA